MRKFRFLFILSFILLTPSLAASNLKDYYHANYGLVERIVFVFDEYPRYRLREDALSINLSLLDCKKEPTVKSKRVIDNPVISKITFVPTDAFTGVLINTFEEYKVEDFVFKSNNDYKLVLDIFKYKNPRSPEEALEYADFYRNVNKPQKAAFYDNFADSLIIASQNPTHSEEESLPEVTKHFTPDPSYTPQENETLTAKLETPPHSSTTTPKMITPSQDTAREPKKAETKLEWMPERFKEVIIDIYHDKMLMISIIIVFGVIFGMLIMSVLRKLHKPKKTEERISCSFGSIEFQRVTIKRLLANGWQVQEIAKELNISTQEVEELGRGLS